MHLDLIDKRLLTELQRDASQSLDSLGDAVGISRNTCWRRVQRLEEEGVILRRVALLDPAKVNVALPVFIVVRTSRHAADATEQLRKAVLEIPEIVGAYRTAGEIDYILQARVPVVVWGAADPKAGAVETLYTLFDDPRLNHRVEHVGHVLADECGRLLTEFFRGKRK